jgi:hypothetical protein
MRVILGGMIGATIAAAVWLGLEHITHLNLGWLACAVGAVTGFSVHRAAGTGSGGSFVRGALSVFLALVAIVGGRQVYVKVVETYGTPIAKTFVAPVTSGHEGAEGQEDAVVEVDAVLTQTSDMTRQRLIDGGTDNSSKVPFKSSHSDWDMLWMCLAAIAAYIIGKGRDEVVSPADTDGPQPEPLTSTTNSQ